MIARIVFLFGLVFTVMNVVMAFTTHSGLIIMAVLGLIITLGSAGYIWGTPVYTMSAMGKDEFEHPSEFFLADEEVYGYTGARYYND